MNREPDGGVVLFNVLVIVAFMALLVMAMVTMGDLAIARSQRFSEAGQAVLYVSAGENTALAALQRDLVDAADTDNLKEPWAQIGQERVEIEGGFFALEITDAQALYNLNNLRPSDAFGAAPPNTAILSALVAGLDLDPDLTGRIADRMAEDPQVQSLTELVSTGVLTVAEADALTTVATVLPMATEINLNTAPLPVLVALIGNPPQARRLEGIRTRNGLLTQEDLSAAQLVPDARSGFASSFYWVRVSVTIGQTEQDFTSLLFRDAEATPTLRVVARNRAVVSTPPISATDETSAPAAPQLQHKQ